MLKAILGLSLALSVLSSLYIGFDEADALRPRYYIDNNLAKDVEVHCVDGERDAGQTFQIAKLDKQEINVNSGRSLRITVTITLNSGIEESYHLLVNTERDYPNGIKVSEVLEGGEKI